MAKRAASSSRRRLTCLLFVAALSGCSTPTFSVDDAVTFEDGSTRFVAFAERKTGWVLRGIRDVEVEFRVGDTVATALTDERGFAKAITAIPEPADHFSAKAEVGGEVRQRTGTLYHWQSDRVIIACDIDSTISATSLGALFFDELDATSQPIGGSPVALNELAESHQIMYVTARPRFTLDKTRAWLLEHGYPVEPVITSLTVGDALAQTAYKTRTLRSLKKFYSNLLIGIGNTDIDADALGAQGMLAVLVQPEARVAREGHIVRLQNWEQVRAFFRDNRELLADPARAGAAARGELELALPVPGPSG